jgi:hypothetical protein
LVAPSGAVVLAFVLVAEMLVPEMLGAAVPVVVLSAARLAVPDSGAAFAVRSGRGEPIW